MINVGKRVERTARDARNDGSVGGTRRYCHADHQRDGAQSQRLGPVEHGIPPEWPHIDLRHRTTDRASSRVPTATDKLKRTDAPETRWRSVEFTNGKRFEGEDIFTAQRTSPLPCFRYAVIRQFRQIRGMTRSPGRKMKTAPTVGG